ncbi:MAG: hypothetical protein P8X82_06455 [Gemmatimonadales bacterium]
MAGRNEGQLQTRGVLIVGLAVALILRPGSLVAQGAGQPADSLFRTSDACIACHNDLTAASGEDISIGFDWRSSMMANAARDPYWQAGVRRETVDHPAAAAAIEDKCSICHMPMARYMAHVTGGSGAVFANLPVGGSQSPNALLAADGVSCSVCHQIRGDNLDSPESFTGGFVLDLTNPLGRRIVHGPFEVDAGRQRLMRSASGFEPTQSSHIQSSALCGSCHTLYTHALNEAGEEVGEMAEQMPYREWQHSAYRDERSCQDCHMPVVTGKAPITGVLAQPRDSVSRHVFRGANFLMPRLLNRYRKELGVQALPQELEATAGRSAEHLRTNSATVVVDDVAVEGGNLTFGVLVENRAGHKVPTAYPSRRAWLHVTVRDRNGGIVFESGALRDNGSIAGNDNDDDPDRIEPHYSQIESQDQVQIYEAIMEHYDGGPTTGLLNGVGYIKDNRLLPRGFEKASAEWDIAVRGNAADDADFAGGSDRVRYSAGVSGAAGPYTIAVELLYQPISYRWARNLAEYDEFEPQRFVRYYDSMSSATHQLVASTSATTR